MEINFYSDAARNYMVLECPSEIRDNYQYKMLAANQIKGLLACSSRTIDSRDYLYYDITSRQSLTDLYERRSVRGEDLRNLLESLVRIEETLAEYLLDSAHLLLEPSCIYIDFQEQTYSFTYYPGEEQERGWETLFTFLADRVEGRDKQAAAMIYRLCMMAERPGFRLKRDMLEEPGLRNDRREKNYIQAGLPDPLEGGRPYRETGNSMSYREDPFRHADQTETDLFRESAYPDYGQEPPLQWQEGVPFQWQEGAPGPGCSGRIDRTVPCGPGAGEPVRGPAGKERMHVRKEGGRLWMLIAGITLIPAGLLLFLLGRWVFLEEKELLLSRAFGGLMMAVGAGLTLARLVLYRRKRRPDGRSSERKAFSGPPGPGSREEGSAWDSMPWEQGWLPELPSSLQAGQPAQLSLRAGHRQGPPVYAEETSLLGRNPGTAAGLYGTGNYRGEQVSLTNLPCVVGKMQEYVDQVLNDTTVSRMHARFWRDAEGGMNVRDLNSTNGTWVNGERLQPNEGRAIEPGDHIRLGRMEFVYR